MSVTDMQLASRRFLRIHYLGFPAILILFGSIDVGVAPDLQETIALLIIALCYHNFAYISNDICDLPVDRTQPLRAHDPLVKGSISVLQASVIAATQIPIALVMLYWVNSNPLVYVVLLVSFALMLVYNVYGKRCMSPPLTDLAQAVGWGLLAFVGSLLVSGEVTELSYAVLTAAVGYILLISGVHGGLRDLHNDQKAGAHTTMIYLGCMTTITGEARSNLIVQIYAFTVFGIMYAVLALYLINNPFGYSIYTLALVSILSLILFLLNTWYLYQVVKTEQPLRNDMISFHSVPLLLPVVFLFAPVMPAAHLLLAIAVFVVPLLASDPNLSLARKIIQSANTAAGILGARARVWRD